MLRLNTHAHVEGVQKNLVLKVLTPEEWTRSGLPPNRTALWLDADSLRTLGLQANLDWGAFIHAGGTPITPSPIPTVSAFRDEGVVKPGDVVSLRAGQSLVNVLYRRGANSNVLFVTERCNSRCIMCSQPPRDDDDSWRIDELKQLIGLIDKSDEQLGFTGGEPTLLGGALLDLIRQCREDLPQTKFQILTNGRLFNDYDFARAAAEVAGDTVLWCVPLYADGPEDHDYVVHAPGAFTETIAGLLNLGRVGQRVEIRMVLQQHTIPRLREFAHFVFRNLAFVEHVALMGIEPMGYARKNHGTVWIDPVDYQPELADSIHFLAARGITTSIYNLPLCVLRRDLWPYARKSISDWKNTYVEACEACSVRDDCSGFFGSIGPGWISRGVAAIPSQ